MLVGMRPLPPVKWDEGDCYGDPIPDECKIPSEIIEPYAQRFLMSALEEIAFYNTPISEVKARLEGVQYFISCYGGLHSEIATRNTYSKFTSTPDDELKRIAKKLFNP
jgi:hypothetical protein